METGGPFVIVVDTNVICYRWIRSPHSDTADKALAKDPDWIAPFLWRSEFRNALAMVLRQKLISIDAAIDLIEKAEARLATREFFISSRAILQLVGKSRCSAYDCEFVALAQEYQVPLVTVDRQILREFSSTAISLAEFAGS